MKNNKKILIVGLITIFVIIGVVGGAFAYFTYLSIGHNEIVIAGDIFMKYTESNKVINASQMIPTANYDPNTFFEFSIIGKNTFHLNIKYLSFPFISP